VNILALDTTRREGSVAVARDGTVLHESAGDPAVTHGERLPGDVAHALGQAGLAIEDVDLLALAAGPGSFTGLRVGVATVQGLAFARGLQVVPVPTLEALARAASESGAASGLTAVWMDAQRGEVFAAIYDAGGREVVAPQSARPLQVLDRWSAREHAIRLADIDLFFGDGAARYEIAIRDALGPHASVADAPPLAGTIARMAFAQPHRAVAPHAIVPIYVRRPDAELARDRREGRT
jgi:tRNA threonylcarbamoyladenosine biosynthesis protein TsaB